MRLWISDMALQFEPLQGYSEDEMCVDTCKALEHYLVHKKCLKQSLA